MRLKERLMNDSLLEVLSEKTLRKKCFRIVNELAKNVNPDRKNSQFDLVTQKNLTLIQLGYIYIDKILL